MDVIKLEPTHDKPGIILDKENNKFEFIGNSLPENANAFYEPILQWFDEYAKDPNIKTIVELKLDYLNTASSKAFFSIFMKIEKIKENGHDVLIKWYYDEDDEDMEEVGEEFDDIIDLSFEHISYEAD